jgi:hypothetical protein
LEWLDQEDPPVGLSAEAYELLHNDDAVRAEFLRHLDLMLEASAAMVVPPEAQSTATSLLRRLIGAQLRKVNGRENIILAVAPPDVIVAPRRSETGQPVPISDVESALDMLRTTGSVTITPKSAGDHNAFIGAVLLTLPGAVISGGRPLVITLDPTRMTGQSVTFEGDLDRPRTLAERGEQATLRHRLFGPATTDQCALCGHTYPVQFLHTAHIKRRSACTDEERRDLTNIAMAACLFGCDALFETGHIAVSASGHIVASPTVSPGTALANQVATLTGRRCLAHTPDNAKYFEWHHRNRLLTVDTDGHGE